MARATGAGADALGGAQRRVGAPDRVADRLGRAGVQQGLDARGAIVFTGFMFAGSLGSYLAGHLLHGSVAASVLLWLVVAVATIGAALLAMALLPRRGRPWPVVIPGALFFGVVVRGMVLATGVYFADRISRANDLYGALGIAIVVLLWLYLLAWGWVAAQFLNAGIAGVTRVAFTAFDEET